MTAYQATFEEFERVTKALTAALIDRNSSATDLSALFAAESRARDAVVLTRMRLVNAWCDSQPDFQLPLTTGDLGKRV